jgi:nitric oxide reductase activation protein
VPIAPLLFVGDRLDQDARNADSSDYVSQAEVRRGNDLPKRFRLDLPLGEKYHA